MDPYRVPKIHMFGAMFFGGWVPSWNDGNGNVSTGATMVAAWPECEWYGRRHYLALHYEKMVMMMFGGGGDE